MHAFRKSTALLLLILGCGPQGRMERVIHPPLDLSRHDQKPQPVTPRTRPGLPEQCLMEVRVKDNFCISCDEGGLDIERCYPFRGLLDDAKACVHSAEHIKCLNANPPFALKIAIKGSLEKGLIENTRIWQESLRTIARPQLDAELQKALEKGLKQTGIIVQLLVKARKQSNWMDEAFPALDSNLKTALARLQADKEAGQLKLIDVLKFSRQVLAAQGFPAPVLPYWEALSVEGLEEPEN